MGHAVFVINAKRYKVKPLTRFPLDRRIAATAPALAGRPRVPLACVASPLVTLTGASPPLRLPSQALASFLEPTLSHPFRPLLPVAPV